MNEIITDAVVLLNQPQNDIDRSIVLLTKELGVIRAKAISGSKMTSKLSPHLNPLNLVKVRLINKNSFIVADALTENNFKNIREDESKLKNALESLFLIQFLTPQETPDDNLWNEVVDGLKLESINKSNILTVLGYSPELSTCFECNSKETEHFLYEDQIFACNNCYNKIASRIKN
ncbi:MAG: recombination protein O N-terminal domain-containing protein [Candidatus Paceibacterota bacterium]